ncbi:hypothetical protein D3C85_1419140 [compost metagenome]
MLERLQVPSAGAEAAFRGLFVAHARFEVLTQQLQAKVCGFSTEGNGDMAIAALFHRNRFTAKVGLVTDQGHLGWVRTLLEELWPEGERIVGLWRRSVHHQQHPVGFAYCLQGTFHADLFHMVGGVAQTGGIDHMQRHAVDVDMFTQDIPGSASDIGDDCCFAPCQYIQQARLAGIRTTGNDHGHAIT